MNKIELVNEHGARVGYVSISGWLPTFLLIDGNLFQRYGEVSAYRYVLEPNVWTPPAKDVERA